MHLLWRIKVGDGKWFFMRTCGAHTQECGLIVKDCWRVANPHQQQDHVRNLVDRSQEELKQWSAVKFGNKRRQMGVLLKRLTELKTMGDSAGIG